MTYQVIDVDSGASFGPFKSLTLAADCVKRVRIKDWEIWDGTGKCVDWRLRYQDGQMEQRVSGACPNPQQLPRSTGE